MKVESLPLLRRQPALHLSALVGAVVIHNQVHLLVGRKILFKMVQETEKFAAATPLLPCADDFAVQDVEGGERKP